MAQQILTTPVVNWLHHGFDSSRWVAINSLVPFYFAVPVSVLMGAVVSIDCWEKRK
jgi:hypothetical protein